MNSSDLLSFTYGPSESSPNPLKPDSETAGIPQATGSPPFNPGRPSSVTTSRLNASSRPAELKKRVNPNRNSFTFDAENTRTFDPIYCSTLVSTWNPLSFRPSLSWFSSPQLYRPNHCEFDDSAKSIRRMN